MTKSLAKKRGCVPGLPFARIIRDWVNKQDKLPDVADAVILRPLPLLAHRMGINVRMVRHYQAGPPWISFNSADKIVCACLGGLWGWQQDPELWEIYESFDFAYLDRVKPCVLAA